MKLAGKTILVTGATGFIGSALCRRLLEEDVVLHAVSRKARQSTDDRLRWWKVDLTKFDQTQELVKAVRADLIFHLAGQVNGALDPALTFPTFINNALSTVSLLAATQTVGCERFVYAASMLDPDPGNFSVVPNSPYAASKLTASIYTKIFYELYDLPVVLLRTFFVYGPGPESKRKLIPYTILSLLKNETPIIRSGTRMVDFVYIDDVVEAYLSAAEGDSLIGNVIDVGSGESISIGDVAAKIADIIGSGVRPVLKAASNKPLELMPVARLEMAEQLLHWRPKVSLETGLKQTVAWYEDGTDRHDG